MSSRLQWCDRHSWEVVRVVVERLVIADGNLLGVRLMGNRSTTHEYASSLHFRHVLLPRHRPWPYWVIASSPAARAPISKPGAARAQESSAPAASGSCPASTTRTCTSSPEECSSPTSNSKTSPRHRSLHGGSASAPRSRPTVSGSSAATGTKPSGIRRTFQPKNSSTPVDATNPLLRLAGRRPG